MLKPPVRLNHSKENVVFWVRSIRRIVHEDLLEIWGACYWVGQGGQHLVSHRLHDRVSERSIGLTVGLCGLAAYGVQDQTIGIPTLRRPLLRADARAGGVCASNYTHLS